MAKGKKTGGRDIVKGQVLNPNGRPKTPEYLKKAKQLNKELLDKYMMKYINSNMMDLLAALEDSKDENTEICSIEVMIIKVILHGINTGDTKNIDFILNRTIGKVKEEVSLSTIGEYDIEKLPKEKLMQLRDLLQNVRAE